MINNSNENTNTVTIDGVDYMFTDQPSELLNLVIARIYDICYYILLEIQGILASPLATYEKIPLVVIPLLANQELIPMPLKLHDLNESQSLIEVHCDIP